GVRRRCGRRCAAGGRDARDQGDVGGNVLGVVAGDEVAGHAGRRDLLAVGARDEAGRMLDCVLDLPVDDVADGRILEALAAGAGKGVVEVWADLPLRARVGERVAAAAFLLEELLAVRGVSLPLRDPAGAA